VPCEPVSSAPGPAGHEFVATLERHAERTPAFSSLGFISNSRLFAALASVQFRHVICCCESVPDFGIAHPGGDQQVQQDAGL
jgi:hypothetical protein